MPAFVRISSVAVLVVLATLSSVWAKELVNKDREGVALQGYDPVAFFTRGEPTPGNPSITASHRGARYQFASAANRDLFAADPDKYAPQYGGHCAYGASQGGLFPVLIETWQIFDGKLVLNKNMDVRRLFDKDPVGTLKRADAKWPGLVEKHGK